jgi:hypothetical protein
MIKMRGSGFCDLCGKKGDWEAGIFNDNKNAKKRPTSWAGFFPTRKLSDEEKRQNWTSPEYCEKNNLDVMFVCPNCYR